MTITELVISQRINQLPPEFELVIYDLAMVRIGNYEKAQAAHNWEQIKQKLLMNNYRIISHHDVARMATVIKCKKLIPESEQQEFIEV